MQEKKTVADYICAVPDFPKPGIIFRDITSVLKDPEGFHLAIEEMQAKLEGLEFDAIVGLESRGFIMGTPLAYNMNKPFVLVRKKGKLPRRTIGTSYALEYGTAEIEIHEEDLAPGAKVVLVDDLIATGGTLKASASLVEQLGAEVVKILCLLELKGLEGRKVLEGYDIDTVVQYEGK